ncbi:phosphoglucomutase first 3 domain-containing protein [Lentinus tigrinus ALCF2SS1-6]|uniref:Phosphoglucomutase first 3 domain-containing protein n=1 Tax=Lentinus tigrinus ALCF2SS1-6 TaxID=1328759 RepID=A0A5C2SPQ3_9APHY|nr:phosphoglucomutase first 3 domain-containing protein [Lentinus tigrinus ALCF2SS1-6]
MTPTLKELVDQWLRLDPNEETRREIEQLIAEGNDAELQKRMSPRIEFGTAGLRGKMEAGWARMNDLIIIQASQGLCAYVIEHVQNARDRGVVVGHDHRYHSERWAKLAAAAFIDQGVPVYFHDGVVHTPLVPFTVRTKGAACGVMITASHNPKVYWENAVQIIEPHDKGISASIKQQQEPRPLDLNSLTASPLLKQFDDVAYFDYIGSLCHYRSLNTQTPLKFVNTSMHGVSDAAMTKAFQLCGFPPYIPVIEQQKPDPEFPTVRFPNPEENGALDLAIATATQSGADYILAQDPDSDRFAAAEKSADGKWIQFTGDQLGTLLASACLDNYKESGKPISKLAMVASTVSSKMIEAMARAEGFKFAECLTGFKYIGNTALTLQQEGYEVPFGYEEAIGFMFGSQLRDKDGVAASVVFAELAASLQRKGKTASSHLRELYAKYGFFQTSNSYFICTEPSTIDSIFARVRNFDGKGTATTPSYPKSIAGLEVTSVRDLTIGYDSANPPSYKPMLPLSSGHMIQFRAENKTDGTKITLTTRTSGTEPKIKYYLEGSGQDASAVARLLPNVVEELSNSWMEAEKNGLGKP